MGVRAVCALLAGVLLAAPVPPARAQAMVLPKGVVLPKDIKLPLEVSVAGYLPAAKRKQRFFVPAGGFWAEPGKALEKGVAAALQGFFSDGFVAGADDARPHNLLVVMHPTLEAKAGKLTTRIAYRVLDGAGAQLLEGSRSAEAPIGDLASGAGFQRTALQAAQLAMVDIVTQLRPSRATHAATGTVAGVDRERLVNREAPVSSGTGFFVNAAGQLLTAAHVTHECVTLEVKQGARVVPAQVMASSNLLDLAVLSTGTPVERYLPLRRQQELVLGEAVTNVGYPLQKLLAATPNLTRGNVSSRGALEGSVGQFQFSAPIQPGSSGGPVVSDGGELLGITQGTLNLAPLVEAGVLPQNVNFALDAAHAARFMQRNGVQFDEVEPNFKADMRTGNEAALATVVSLSCYQ